MIKTHLCGGTNNLCRGLLFTVSQLTILTVRCGDTFCLAHRFVTAYLFKEVESEEKQLIFPFCLPS